MTTWAKCDQVTGFVGELRVNEGLERLNMMDMQAGTGEAFPARATPIVIACDDFLPQFLPVCAIVVIRRGPFAIIFKLVQEALL